MARLTMADLTCELMEGDQIFVRTEIAGGFWNWIGGFLIRLGTFTDKDKEPSDINHTANILRRLREDPWDPHSRVIDYVIGEALGKGGFQERRLLEAYGDTERYSFAVTRHDRLSMNQRGRVAAALRRLLGRPYAKWMVVTHGLDYAVTRAWNAVGGPGDVYIFRWLYWKLSGDDDAKRYPMCSWASLYGYREAGRPFSTSLVTGSPDDLWDECRAKTPGIWSWLYYAPSLERAIFGYVARRRRS